MVVSCIIYSYSFLNFSDKVQEINKMIVKGLNLNF